ncbi:hypothetical protein A3F52_05600 [Candidatus Uhrbacteria bacterium RIFCSPHIGHO2_12_FULL_47_11]|nr:MAG: hypothetical protein A3F52_05600 [Candidatus Uhrbacteria bacterium RIFCSPHIGHO2_12_FULL_47_11]
MTTAPFGRVHLYLDGGNFHHLVLKRLHVHELDFSFDQFAHFLANGRVVTGKRFYVGTVRERVGDLKSKATMARQTKLFTVLHGQGWEIKTSKLRTRFEHVVIDERVKGYQELRQKGFDKIEYERTREKGIDVKLAIDLIVGAVDNQYDTAIIVSSDADLVPAIDWIRYRMKKKVEYVGFSLTDSSRPEEVTRPLQTMIAKSDIQRILVASDLRRFFKS